MVQTRYQKRRKLNANDYISCLPDDLLLHILSKLGLKEAARTTLLSTRWKNLWTLITTSLNIIASEFIPDADLIQNRKLSRIKTLKFVNTANQILRQNKSPTVHQLSITYPIGALCDSRKVDGWIDIAITKQVKALSLNFNLFLKQPVPFLSLPSKTFFSLVNLTLKFASLTSAIIHSLLSNSPNLQDLSIIRANGFLQRLKINAPSLKLKHIELLDNNIEFLEVSAPKLLSFKFSTRRKKGTEICFKYVPLLTQLSYSEKLALHTRYDYSVLLHQLETLTLILPTYLSGAAVVVPEFPALRKLKQLHLTFGSGMDAGLCLFLRLFNASPSLCGLSLNFDSHACEPLKEFSGDTSGHKFLRKVEIDGFCGYHYYELKVLICIARSSSSLEKIVIHPNLYTEKEFVWRVFKKLESRLSLKKLEILFEERNPPPPEDWEMF